MTVVRRTLSALWLSLALAVLAVVGLSHVAPALGYRLVVIAGPSMSPTIPLGAVVIERTISASEIVVGDVVTVQMPNGVSITHRVVRLGAARGETYLETRGDANDAADPTVVPASAVTGVVAISLPLLGFLLAFLAVPSGVASIVLTLAALMFAIWTLEELDGARDREREAGTAPDVVDGLPA
jgi:signal peptidase I